jgi:hypothetical protein
VDDASLQVQQQGAQEEDGSEHLQGLLANTHQPKREIVYPMLIFDSLRPKIAATH